MPTILEKTILDNPLIVAFAFVGLVIWLSNWLAHHVTRGRVAGSAIAVLSGLALAYLGGVITGKTKGLADLSLFSGLALMGGAMMR
ncbi:MAG TPA: malonate transporter subunit MadM, partial [Rhodoblastus sp.]|nr:malonate transporter subunit MadM [Rhodoblastus sp.]